MNVDPANSTETFSASEQARLFDLTDRIAVVTGGAQGFGRTFALGLARQGADVVILDINEKAAQEVRKEVADSSGRKVLALGVDVSQKPAVDAAFSEIKAKLGIPDILVNNAGIWSRVPAIDLSLEEWNRVLSINLTGTLLCSQAAARLMLQRGSGSIVNISSISGVLGLVGRTAYSASKHGILGITKTCANEWAPHGIRVNAIGPGSHETTMTAEWRKDPEVFKTQILGKIPMGRMGRPEELLGALIYLASNASSFMTGQVIFSDGGRLLG